MSPPTPIRRGDWFINMHLERPAQSCHRGLYIQLKYIRRSGLYGFLILFCESSTAILKAPRRAVNCIFSEPPTDNLCLKSCISAPSRQGAIPDELTRTTLGGLIGISDSVLVARPSLENHMLQLLNPVMPTPFPSSTA
jgi:hypothetical protein